MFNTLFKMFMEILNDEELLELNEPGIMKIE